MDLERELRALQVEWPETPAFALVRRPRRRRPWLVAIALALVAIGAAFAVPQSRGAILRFFHLGGETIRIVDTLPRAQQRPLGVGLGPAVSLADAESVVPRLLLPSLPSPPPLHETGNVVSLVFTYRGRPVLLSELSESFGGGLLKKLAGSATVVQPQRVGADAGLWLSGRHVFFFPNVPPRLAGNALVWVHGGFTYRLEGPELSRDDALALAQSLRERYPGKG
jgi:hypothetical protein